MNMSGNFLRILTFSLIPTLLFAACGGDEDPAVIVDENDENGDNGNNENNQNNENNEDLVDTVPEFFAAAEEADYGDEPPAITVIADSEDGVDDPNDLEFHPSDERKNELWILNEGVANTGGETVTLYDAGGSDQEADVRRDGNAWHFMSMPTAIAFSDDTENFATGIGVQDANHDGGTFAGPTMWSSDMEIYAEVNDPPEVNGSHLDMLHGSPYAMGIAHDEGNAFWVFDGYHGHLVRYDFQDPHVPGGHDHDDGLVHRYEEVEVERHDSAPSHMIVDEDSGWLYINDTGNEQILRFDTNSGTQKETLPIINEQLEEHWEMHEADWEVFADQALEQPVGMAIKDNRLFISDRITGDIIAFDTDSGEELARVYVGEGIRGITIGPEGALWFANYTTDEVGRLDPK